MQQQWTDEAYRRYMCVAVYKECTQAESGPGTAFISAQVPPPVMYTCYWTCLFLCCVCLGVCASGCVWLSLPASKGAGFILTLIMRERLAMPSSHFSTSSILPVASGCFSFLVSCSLPFSSVDNLPSLFPSFHPSFLSDFLPLSPFSAFSCHHLCPLVCVCSHAWLTSV